MRSNVRGFAQLLGHLGVLAATGFALLKWWATPWVLPLLVIHGFVLIFLFCADHECVHRTAFRSRAVNDAVAAITGLFLLLPSRWFRLFHAAHHRYTQDSQNDPELDAWKPPSRRGIVLQMSGFLYWRAMAQIIWNLSRGKATASWMPTGHAKKVVQQARVMLAIYGSIVGLSLATESWLVVKLWIVPALVGQPFLRIYLLLEHTGCPVDAGTVVGTRTTLTNPVMRFFAWNMPFHREHHAQPQVPFHQLPELHRTWSESVLDHGGVVDRGYLRTAFRLQRQRWRAAR
jgi:fatty acid desaturase